MNCIPLTLVAAAFFLVLFSSNAANETRDATSPNVIFILVDDMGWSDLGCFGSEIDTPHLDRLAQNGIRFTNFYNTSKCFPSRACLLTGTYAQVNGNDERHGEIQNAITLGEALQECGYNTFFVGKHHGTENLYHRGFDHYYGLRDGAANHFNPGYPRPGEPAPAQKRLRTFCFDQREETPFTPGLESNYYSTDSYTDWAIRFLERYKNSPKPFFLYLSYQAPHDPLQAWPEDIEKYADAYKVGFEKIASERYRKQLASGLIDERFPRSEATFHNWDELDSSAREDQARRMAVYAAMIDRLDQNVGRLIQTLEDNGALENTLILFASDNGSSAEIVEIGEGEIGSVDRWSSLGGNWANVSNTPFRRFKNYSHEGGIRTPLIAHWPARISHPGSVSEFRGHFIDVMPTLLEIAGGHYPETYAEKKLAPLSGISFAAALQGTPIQRPEPLFWHWSKGAAIAEGKWKLVRYGDTDWELFDIEQDQTETQDLSRKHPDLVKNLAEHHAQWLEQSRATYQSLSEANGY